MGLKLQISYLTFESKWETNRPKLQKQKAITKNTKLVNLYKISYLNTDTLQIKQPHKMVT